MEPCNCTPERPTYEQIEERLAADVYMAAATWFEGAENAGLIRGNGHHVAQEVAAFAVRRLRELRVENKVGAPAPDGNSDPL